MGEERKWLYHLSLGWLFLSEDGQGEYGSGGNPMVAMDDTRGVQSTDWLYLIENLTPPEFTTTPVVS